MSKKKKQEWDVVLPPLKAFPIPRSLAADQKITKHQAALNIGAIWDKGGKGQGVIVYIGDTEADLPHPDLKPKTDARLNINATGIAGSDRTHGVHVAGIAGAVDNAFGVIGSAPNCKLAAVKMLHNGRGVYSWIANGIRAVADQELPEEYKDYKKLLNMSLGGSAPSSELEEAIDYAISKGVFVVAAAGNSGAGNRNWPGAYEQVITVGSLDSSLEPSDFSSTYEEVDVAVMGEGRYSTYGTDAYAYLSGTSMASPDVAGLCACILSLHPEIDHQEQLEAYLEENATDIYTEGEDNATGAGFPKADGYLEYDGEEPDPKPDPDPDPPKPPKPDKPDRKQPRNLIASHKGPFSIIWKRSGEDASVPYRTLVFDEIEIEHWTKLDYLDSAKVVYDKIADFFRNRGLILLENHDTYDAIYWAMRFMVMLRFKDENITIRRVKTKEGLIRDEGLQQLEKMVAKDSPEPYTAALPAELFSILKS